MHFWKRTRTRGPAALEQFLRDWDQCVNVSPVQSDVFSVTSAAYCEKRDMICALVCTNNNKSFDIRTFNAKSRKNA